MVRKSRTPNRKKSCRIKKRSLRGMKWDEYLLACGEIEGISDGNKDAISENENGGQSERDVVVNNIVEVDTTGNTYREMEVENVIESVHNTGEVDKEMMVENIPENFDNHCVIEPGSIDDSLLKSGSMDIVFEENMNEINRGVIHKVDGMTLLSLPEGVCRVDPDYVRDISFAIDGGERKQWKQLKNMSDLFEHSSDLFELLFDWKHDVAAMIATNSISDADQLSPICTNCRKYDIVSRKLEIELNLREVEVEKVSQEKTELSSTVKKLTAAIF